MKNLGGLPGIITAITAATLTFKAVQLALMSETEIAALHGIAKWAALGIAKAYAESFATGVLATVAIPAAIGGVIGLGT